MAKRKRRQAQRLDDNPVIGYVATLTPQELWGTGEAYLVADSETQMQNYLAGYLDPDASVFRIAIVRLETLLFGLRAGEVYAFDAEAYRRFYPLTQRAGLAINPEALSLAPPSGLT